VTAAAVAVLLLQPVTAPPSYAGIACDGPLPLPADDCVAPTTKLTATPTAASGGTTTSRVAGFAFTTEVPEGRVTFACRLDGPSQAHDWQDCTDPSGGLFPTTSTGSRLYTGLALGTYTFSVRATDAFPLGPNTEDPPKTHTWTVVEPDGSTPPDGSAPETTITSKTPRWVLAPFHGIRYRADEEAAGFRCTLNGAAQDCGYYQANLLGLGPRDYVFRVAAIDLAGNVDPTPALARWTVPFDDPTMRTSKGWRTKRGSGHFKDTVSVSTRKGATIQLGNKGYRSAVLVVTKCPGCGSIAISLKNQHVRNVSLNAARVRQKQVVKVGSWKKPRSGVVRVTVRSAGKEVAIDGIGFSKRR
jgi:hypothetical protein